MLYYAYALILHNILMDCLGEYSQCGCANLVKYVYVHVIHDSHVHA